MTIARTPLKAGQPVIDAVKLSYIADEPILLSGPHGVGKSQLFAQAAADLGVDFISRDLSMMEPPDLTGMPDRVDGQTVYLPPAFLPKTGRGILLFEELNRAPRYMRSPCNQLLTDRCLNDYVLPAGWLPAAAINPSNESYDVDDMDDSLVSRFVGVGVIADRKHWLQWAKENGVNALVIDYVKSDESVFKTRESNPRAWVKVSNLLCAAEKCDIARSVLRAAIAGTVGNARATAFWRFLRNPERPLSPEAIIKTYSQHRNQVQRWVSDGALDLVHASLRNLLVHLQLKQTYEQVKSRSNARKNMAQFFADLPADLTSEAAEFFAERGDRMPTLRK